MRLEEKVPVLGKCLKKKDTQHRFYKSTTENRSFFKKEQIYIIRKKKEINDVIFIGYEIDSEKIVQERFQGQELYALN